MKKMMLGLVCSAGVLFAQEALIQKAKEASLLPIPEAKSELYQLIEDENNKITARKVELGKKLYFDPRLSASGLISCNTCHNLAMGGDDNIPVAIGDKWTKNPHHLNSPTVYNAVLNKVQFWDGRSPHLEDQAQGPIQALPEMAAPKSLVEKRINSIPAYVKAFKEAYGEKVKVDFERIASTIAVFERTLITPSRYDDYLLGDKKALSNEEKVGMQVFIDKGCASCHNDIALGGSMQPFNLSGNYKYDELGDFKGDKNGNVRVPTLRNITQTAPYYHNGAIWSLAEAIEEMAKVQLGTQLTKQETRSIETFLHALDGRKPQIVYPELPVSSLSTPKPQL